MIITRYIYQSILEDLREKMVFLSGPRQVGKTTLAKTLLSEKDDRYFNWDRRNDRKAILAAKWPASSSIVIIDELHKYSRWKQWIKGEYDTHGNHIRFLVTGSARLDVYRKGGDSLQGRYHSHRLHPFSIGELEKTPPTLPQAIGKELQFVASDNQETLESLLHFGPFPEPFLKHNERTLRRWQRERLDRFFREDVRDLENVRDLSAMELLASLLEERIGSTLSIQSLREDLEVSHKAVSHWLDILERLYYCFRIHPYTHKAVRSLKKAAKLYLWDWARVPDTGARFENLVAGHLLKMKHRLEDQEGYNIGLHYLRDAAKREVDFLITQNNTPWFAVECKASHKSASKHLTYFGERLQIPYLYQLSLHGDDDIYDGNVRVMPAAKFLTALP